jgi:hypothetical protein
LDFLRGLRLFFFDFFFSAVAICFFNCAALFLILLLPRLTVSLILSFLALFFIALVGNFTFLDFFADFFLFDFFNTFLRNASVKHFLKAASVFFLRHFLRASWHFLDRETQG